MTPETGGRLMGQIFQREWPDFKGVRVFFNDSSCFDRIFGNRPTAKSGKWKSANYNRANW